MVLTEAGDRGRRREGSRGCFRDFSLLQLAVDCGLGLLDFGEKISL
jgi:hypothetical protein